MSARSPKPLACGGGQHIERALAPSGRRRHAATGTRLAQELEKQRLHLDRMTGGQTLGREPQQRAVYATRAIHRVMFERSLRRVRAVRTTAASRSVSPASARRPAAVSR
jgi:ribosomal protein S8E